MRQGEILSLRWEHVDLQHGVAHLPTTKNGAPRDVPLSRKARSYLQMLPIQLNGNIFLTHLRDSKVPGEQHFRN